MLKVSLPSTASYPALALLGSSSTGLPVGFAVGSRHERCFSSQHG